MSSPLLDKAALTIAGTMGWIFLTALKVSMDHALCDAVQVCNVQRCLEELAQCIVVLEQELHAPEEPSISDSELVREHCETKERYKTLGPHLLARPVVQQKDRAKEAWMLWEAKENRNGTDSAVRMKSRKASKEQGLTPVERETKGKRERETIESGQGLPNPSLWSPEKSAETAESQKCHSGWQVKCRKYKDLSFRVVDNDGETILVLGTSRTSILSASTLAQ